ncbi:hypothetical protein FRC18_004908 [Serendipita sp. 400]|nr:hypothetical protein FRC18_004908 [Serendipita sp. 400]
MSGRSVDSHDYGWYILRFFQIHYQHHLPKVLGVKGETSTLPVFNSVTSHSQTSRRVETAAGFGCMVAASSKSTTTGFMLFLQGGDVLGTAVCSVGATTGHRIWCIRRHVRHA